MKRLQIIIQYTLIKLWVLKHGERYDDGTWPTYGVRLINPLSWFVILIVLSISLVPFTINAIIGIWEDMVDVMESLLGYTFKSKSIEK